MAASSDHLGVATQPRPRLVVLLSLGLLSLGLYVGLTVLSFRFEADATNPPILLAVVLLGGASLVWLIALAAVFRCQKLNESRAALGMILGFAVAFRVLLLLSAPIQETDYYRYLWDGRVMLGGQNPYHYSPYQVESLPSLIDEPPEE